MLSVYVEYCLGCSIFTKLRKIEALEMTETDEQILYTYISKKLRV